MAEIMLAPGRGDLKPTIDLLETRLVDIFGVKILINDAYIFGASFKDDTSDLDEIKRRQYRFNAYDRSKFKKQDPVKKIARYGAVACRLREKGVERILLDARTPNDKPVEMVDITNSLIVGYNNKSARNKKVPNFQTVHYSAGRASLSAFKDTVEKQEIEPVCFTTSSMITEQDYIDMYGSSREFVKRSTDVVSELGFKAVLVAARDAELVHQLNPKLKVVATGGLLVPDEETDHQRTALFEETRDFVDVYAIGTPILQAGNPEEAFDERNLCINK